MVIEDRTQDVSLGTLAIHINTMRVMWATILPQLAELAPNPREWLAELQNTATLAVDYATFPQVFHIDPEMMKAAVAGSMEEMFAGAHAVLNRRDAE